MLPLLLLATTLTARLPFAAEMVVSRGPEQVTLQLSGVRETLPPNASDAELAQAWMRLVDARTGWSKASSWRRLNRWESPLLGDPIAANLSEHAFASPVGRFSPRDDLASFAAGALLEPHVACRLRSQWRFLRDAIASLEPDDRPQELDEPTCRAFERWSAREHLDHVELVLASPSTATMGSLFGHLILRLVYRGEGGAMLDDRFIAFLADNDVPIEADPLYALKGLGGVYTAKLAERGLGQVLQEYVVQEGRDLRRYRLNLTPAELERLFDRLWTARGALEQRYYFLQDNCATMLLELLRDVLDDDAAFTYPNLIGAGPTGALDGLTLVRRRDGTPLVEPIHEAWTSLHREAIDAAHARAEAERELPHSNHFAAAREPGDARRAAAIRGFALQRKDDPHPAIDRWLAAQATIELHLARVANAEAEKRLNTERFHRLNAEARTRCDAIASSHPELKSAVEAFWSPDRVMRHEAFGTFAKSLARLSPDEANELRRCAALHLVRLYGDRLQTRPEIREPLFFPDPSLLLEEQPWAAPIAELLAWTRVTKLTPGLHACQQARADRRRRFATPAWSSFREAERERREVEAEARWNRGWPHTGIDGTTLGVDLFRGGAGFKLGGAIFDERLGDRRRNGFPGHTAFTFLRSETTFAMTGVLESNLRVVGWRSLAPELREEKGLLAPFGWEAFLDVDASSFRGFVARPRLGGSALLPIAGSRDLATHLVLRAGGDWSLAAGPERLSHGFAGLLGIEARWTPDFFGGRHFFEATGTWRTGFDLRSMRLWHEASARAALSFGLFGDLVLPLFGHTGVRLVAGVRHEHSTGPFVPLTRSIAEFSLLLD